MPSVDPWFKMPIKAGFTLPSGDIYGSFDIDFKAPKATGSIINTSNLSELLFDQQKWYVAERA